MAQAAARLDVVLLELLARAAPVAGLAAGEVAADQLVVELEAGRKPGDDDREPGPVRLARGDIRELHEATQPTRRECQAVRWALCAPEPAAYAIR